MRASQLRKAFPGVGKVLQTNRTIIVQRVRVALMSFFLLVETGLTLRAVDGALSGADAADAAFLAVVYALSIVV